MRYDINQADWDDGDSPSLTHEELDQMRPAREVLPAELLEAQLPSWLRDDRKRPKAPDAPGDRGV